MRKVLVSSNNYLIHLMDYYYKYALFFFFTVLLYTCGVNAQISIRDTIKINPNNTTNDESNCEYNLSVYNPNCVGSYAIVGVNPGDCYGWYQHVSLRIVEGADIASFYYLNNEIVIDMGDTILASIHDLDVCYYGVQCIEGLSNASITIESEIEGVYDSVTVYFISDDATYLVILPPDIKIMLPGEYLQFGAEVQGDMCADIPYGEVVYNVEIIEGSEFGTLYYSETGEWGKQLLNIDLDGAGNTAFFYFFADGEKPENAVEVKIRITLIEPYIMQQDIIFTIDPDLEPLVSIVPSTLSPGETANIFINKRNPDGSISKYYDNATFEIGMLEGCVNGNIVTQEGSGSYFYEVPQPIQFVAADSIEGDSGIVKLRIGVVWKGDDGGGGIPCKTIHSDSVDLRKNFDVYDNYSKAKKRKNHPAEILAEECYIGDYYTPVHWTGDIKITNSCNFAEYDPNEYQIPYILQKHDNYYTWLEKLLDMVQITDVCIKPDPNQTGGSVAVPYTRIRKNVSNVYSNSWDIKPLIDEEDRLHFEIVDPDFQMPTNLIFDFVCGVCTLKINPPGNDNLKTLLNSIDDINYQNISVSDAPQAFYDFCGHNCYPQTINKYVLVEIINLHENEHMEDYKQIVKDNYSELVSIIKNYSIACSSYNAEAKANSVKVILSMINKVINKSMKQYAIMNEAADRGDYSYERQIQGRSPIANKITEYIDELRKKYSLNNNYYCTNCSNN